MQSDRAMAEKAGATRSRLQRFTLALRSRLGPSTTTTKSTNSSRDTGKREEGEVKGKGTVEGKAKEEDKATLPGLQQFPHKYILTRVETEAHANVVLGSIQDGDIGFDTEFTDRRSTPEEKLIEDRFGKGTALRKAAILGWQIVELGKHKVFPVTWKNIGLRLVQIARDNDVWVLDMWKIQEAMPKELKRILESSNIKKTGGGLIRDISVVWDNLRIEMRNLVDVGMMAKLVLAEKYPKMVYGNLALKTSVEDILGFELPKDQSATDWGSEMLTEEQIQYAGLDAIASIRLYEVLVDALKRQSNEIGQEIPAAWYRFNSRSGEPTRMKLSAEGTEITWRTSDCTWYVGGKFQGYP
ncbi:ribonuclease H-like domain-containing protein [Mycena rosella]|uniref:3'-5' exonuclease n=1 Tax=Mycena rosella TaxID=1033263 RepID=A0AAD7DQQ6_MYCRO|nr:ribonuclease H-like domain-containing protein [Mycena rosella]